MTARGAGVPDEVNHLVVAVDGHAPQYGLGTLGDCVFPSATCQVAVADGAELGVSASGVVGLPTGEEVAAPKLHRGAEESFREGRQEARAKLPGWAVRVVRVEGPCAKGPGDAEGQGIPRFE